MLHTAIAKQNWNEVQKLLKISYVNVNERDKTLQTPLHTLCTMGQQQLVEVLVQRNADVNAVDVNNWAPIHCAAANYNLEIVAILLNHPKINLTLVSKDGTSMFHYLMRNIVSSDKEKFYYQILAKSKEKGADIKLMGQHMESPLHQAVSRGNVPAIKFLIENKVNINGQNKYLFQFLYLEKMLTNIL